MNAINMLMDILMITITPTGISTRAPRAVLGWSGIDVSCGVLAVWWAFTRLICGADSVRAVTRLIVAGDWPDRPSDHAIGLTEESVLHVLHSLKHCCHHHEERSGRAA